VVGLSAPGAFSRQDILDGFATMKGVRSGRFKSNASVLPYDKKAD
jgi:hypothetical protein